MSYQPESSPPSLRPRRGPPPRAIRRTREEVLAILDPDPVVPHVSGRVSAGHAAAAASLGPRPPPVEPPLEAFGPITLEDYLAKKERSHTRKRERLNQQRVEMLCHPFYIERRAVMRRTVDLTREVNRITDMITSLESLRHRVRKDNKKKYVEGLQDTYMLERLQKQEEIMRLTDRLIELPTIIENIHKQYEVPYVERPVAFGFGGGAPNKTATQRRRNRRRHKWSLKYKRSINCNHPKGFSQRQHCKYGRKNVTKKH
jgi:hypothetical protein